MHIGLIPGTLKYRNGVNGNVYSLNSRDEFLRSDIVRHLGLVILLRLRVEDISHASAYDAHHNRDLIGYHPVPLMS
jgi:hypothetical protein